jgi:hypothetical protein
MANLLIALIDAYCKGCEIYHEMQVAAGLAAEFHMVDKDQLAEQGSDEADFTFAALNAQSRQKYWWDDQQLFRLRKN